MRPAAGTLSDPEARFQKIRSRPSRRPGETRAHTWPPQPPPPRLQQRPEITADDIRLAIQGRHPEACPLPDHPTLDLLLAETVCEFDWVPDKGHYKNRIKTSYTVTSASRLPTDCAAPLAAGPVILRPTEPHSPTALAARQLEIQLARAARHGQFVAVLVPPRHHDLAIVNRPADYGFKVIDVEAELLSAMHSLAERRPLLVPRAVILARHDLLDLIEALQQSSGTRGGVPAVWLLIPGGDASLDGVVVPLETSGQKALVPRGRIQKYVPRSRGGET